MEVLFIKFNYINMLNQYLANIYITICNLYNLYFNLKGEGSSSIRNNLSIDIYKFNNMYIKLSFLIKKIGGYPIINLDEIKNISTIKQLSSKDYTPKTAIKLLLNDLNNINNMNNQVGDYSLRKLDFKSINLILEFNNYLERRLKFLNNK